MRMNRLAKVMVSTVLVLVTVLAGWGKQAIPEAEAKSNTTISAANRQMVFYNGPKKVKKVALTFDDGPDEKFTEPILDILKEKKVQATFFLLGKKVEAFPKVAKRIAKEGHAIGNHSWSHAQLTELDDKSLKLQINKADQAMKKVVGFEPSLFRAPYGALSDPVVEELVQSDHHIIGWSVDPRDWDGRTADKIVDNVKKYTKPGAIILLHSSGGYKGDLSNTVAALPKIIEYLQSKGYEFVTVPELLAIHDQKEAGGGSASPKKPKTPEEPARLAKK